MAWLLLALLLAILAALTIDLAAPPSAIQRPVAVIVLGCAILFLLAYGLNRGGYYQAAAATTVGITAAGAWVSLLSARNLGQPNPLYFTYQVVAVLLSSVLLSARVTALLAVVQVIGVALVLPGGEFISAVIFDALVSGVLVVAALIRERDSSQIEQQTQALSSSEARFRSAVDYSPIGMSLMGLDGRWLQVNRALCDIVGYSEAELLAMTFQRITHPDDLQADLENVRRLLAGEIAAYQIEMRYFHKDGRIVWIQLSVSLVRDAQGAPLHFISQIQDVTERRRADQQLRDAETHFRTLVEQIPAITYMGLVGGEQHTLYISPQIKTILGFTAEEWMADAGLWRRQIHFDDRAWVLAADDRSTTTGEPFVAEYRILTKDGRVRWLHDETHQVSAESGPPRFYMGLEFDVTERRETEEALRESTARYRQMFEEAESLRQFNATVTDTMAEGLAVEDSAGRLSLVNPKLCSMLGYAVAELIGQKWSFIVPPSALAEVEAQSRLRPLGMSSTYETRLLTKTGAEIPVLISAAPFARDGRYQGTVVTLVDISGQKRGERALQEANLQLENLLRQMEQRTREIALVTEMGDLLQAALSFEEAYGVVRELAGRLFPATSGALHILNPERNRLEVAAGWGGEARSETSFAPDECWALRRGHPHLVEIGHPELLCPHARAAEAVSTLCVPLLAQGEALGIFFLRCNREGLSPGTRQLAQTVADRVSLELANLRLRETLRQQSIRDPLTNLFNRRYLEETLEREVSRSARNKRPLGIIMLDVDHFKKFNDTFGHEAGDALLAGLGRYLAAHIRTEDIACRYGGEEFTLILPDAPPEVTAERAEHLRAEAGQLRVQFEGKSLGEVALSLGVAVFPEHGADGPAVLHAADAALYQAKRAGRNRVVVASSGAAEPPAPAAKRAAPRAKKK